jgi:protein TonB
MTGSTSSSRRREWPLGWALLTSLALHVGVLLPIDWRLPPPPARTPPLAVLLPPAAEQLAPVLTTQPELLDVPAPAVTPAPSLPVPGKPRELKGRALESAMAALAREEFYPREAISRGWEGRVVLLLSLDPSGRVTDIEIASPSGYLLLDQAAVKAAVRISAIPGGRRQALLPVEFRLE